MSYTQIRFARSLFIGAQVLCLFLPSLSIGQQRMLVDNSRFQLGTEENLSASIRCGDLDGDGDMDLVVANGRHWPQQNYVFLNDGKARFTEMRPLGAVRSTSYACELSDLDGDGDLDIVTGNDMAPCEIFVNDGRANFAFATNLAEISSVRSITVSDVTGDDKPDIIVTCRGQPNRIHINRGQLDFSQVIYFGTQNDSTIDVEVADLDDDLLVDLVVANRDSQFNALLRNRGNGEFESSSIGDRKDNSRAVALADFDADGLLDAAFGNIGSANQIVFGVTGGRFQETHRFGPEQTQTYCLAAADMDLDGDIDLVVGNVADRNSIFFNQGDGRKFTQIDFGSPSAATYGLCVADFDGDRFPDVAVANSGAANRVFINRPQPNSAENTTQRVAQAVAEPTASDREATGLGEGDTSQSEPAAGSVTSLASVDWPMFRGAESKGLSQGFRLPVTWNATAGEAEKNVLWRSKIPGLGHSSPVIVGDRVLLATAVAEQGEAPLQVGRSGAPGAADDNGRQSWMLCCYDKHTGQQLWEQTAHRGIPRATRHAKATHASSTLAVEGDNVVAFFGSEGLYCYDLQGNLRWKRDLGVINVSKYGIGWGYASSPAIHDGRIVLICDDPDDPYVVALSLATGDEIWRVQRKGDCERSWGSPLIFAQGTAAPVQVVVNGWPSVVSYDLDNGEELWRIHGGGDNPIPTPFVAHGHIYITSAHGADSPIHVVRPSARGDITEKTKQTPNDSVLWSVPRGGCYMSTPVVVGDLLYLGNSNGILRCYNALTGEKLYENRLGNDAGIIASLVAGDDKIYCASENGTVYVVAAGPEFSLLAENPMQDPCFATPAISGGVIYIRTTREVVAIRAP
ncbi:MAG: FG-GAP-like repeat-containing protein [bacterium]|nr:FG-GAP-like repeat-containing protein [bacterium]